MATAKPKRMMFGGVAKGAMNSVKKAVAAKSAPKQMQFMSDKLRGAPAKPQMQFMSDKLRGAPAKPAPMFMSDKLRGAPAKPAPMPSQGQLPSKLAGVAKAFSQQKSGATGTGSQRVMKKGGAVKKKATKK